MKKILSPLVCDGFFCSYVLLLKMEWFGLWWSVHFLRLMFCPAWTGSSWSSLWIRFSYLICTEFHNVLLSCWRQHAFCPADCFPRVYQSIFGKKLFTNFNIIMKHALIYFSPSHPMKKRLKDLSGGNTGISTPLIMIVFTF